MTRDQAGRALCRGAAGHAGIIVACGMINAVMAIVSAAVNAITGIVNSANAEQAALTQKLVDNSTFPVGWWSVATSDMSDDGEWQVGQ